MVFLYGFVVFFIWICGIFIWICDIFIWICGRDLARNEEFSEIAVINIFLQFSKKKTSYLWGGGVLRGKFRDKSRN